MGECEGESPGIRPLGQLPAEQPPCRPSPLCDPATLPTPRTRTMFIAPSALPSSTISRFLPSTCMAVRQQMTHEQGLVQQTGLPHVLHGQEPREAQTRHVRVTSELPTMKAHHTPESEKAMSRWTGESPKRDPPGGIP